MLKIFLVVLVVGLTFSLWISDDINNTLKVLALLQIANLLLPRDMWAK